MRGSILCAPIFQCSMYTVYTWRVESFEFCEILKVNTQHHQQRFNKIDIMRCSNLTFFYIFLTSVIIPSLSQKFQCADRSNRCREWRSNVARRLNRRDAPSVCADAGNDYEFLLQNCPRYCNLCDVAKERWERDQENARMEMSIMNRDFKEIIQRPECDVVSGSTWQHDKSTYTFRDDGIFVASSDMTCQKSRCKWSCEQKSNGKLKIQIKFNTKGLHEASIEPSSKSLKLRRVFNRVVTMLDLVNRDLYGVLGVSKDSEQSEIRKRYRTLSRSSHPDRLSNPTEADRERFEEITRANDILGDPDRRRIYDAFGASEFHSRNAYENAVKRGAVKRIVGGFYKNSPSVKTITSGTFVRDVYSKQATLIEFYSPWCYHCQQMVGNFKKTAILLETDNIVAGAVDCDANRDVCQQLRINNYPTIRFFPGYRKAAGMGITYDGEHDPDAIRTFVDSIVNDRVEELSEADFRSKVLDSNDDSLIWLIDFSANAWCGPCTQLRQSIRGIAREIEDSWQTARSLVSDSWNNQDKHAKNHMRVRVGYVECFR